MSRFVCPLLHTVETWSRRQAGNDFTAAWPMMKRYALVTSQDLAKHVGGRERQRPGNQDQDRRQRRGDGTAVSRRALDEDALGDVQIAVRGRDDLLLRQEVVASPPTRNHPACPCPVSTRGR